jgi:hypothetical protein
MSVYKPGSFRYAKYDEQGVGVDDPNAPSVPGDGNSTALAVLGDSYFANAATVSGGVRWAENAMSPAIAMNTLLGGPWDIVTDGAVSGQTSAQWISNSAQLAAVLASPAKLVFVGFPTNDPDLLADAGAGIAATSIANLAYIYDQINAAGKSLIVVNGGNKNSWTAIQRGHAQQISDWVTATAQASGYPCVDMMGAITDPATGIGSTSLMLSDGGSFVHPNPAGHLYAAARSVGGFARFAARPISSSGMAVQGLYNTALAGNASGYPAGSSAYTIGTPTGVSATKLPRVDGPGEFVRLTATSDAANSRMGMQTAAISFTAAWSAGAKALGQRCRGSFGDQWVCTIAGTSSGSEPAAMAAASQIGQQVTDAGGVTWTRYKNIAVGSRLSIRVEFDMTSVSGGNSGAQPVLLLNFNGAPTPYSGIRAGVIGGSTNELCQKWTFPRQRRPVLVAPYQVPVPAGATGMQMYLYQQWDSAGVTSSLDIYGIECRID